MSLLPGIFFINMHVRPANTIPKMVGRIPIFDVLVLNLALDEAQSTSVDNMVTNRIKKMRVSVIINEIIVVCFKITQI